MSFESLDLRYNTNMNVAIVHDQLVEFGGAERVLLVLKEILPQAPVYTTVFDKKKLPDHQKAIKIGRSTHHGLEKFRS